MDKSFNCPFNFVCNVQFENAWTIGRKYISRKTQKTNQANIKTQKIENRAGNVTVPATTT